MAAGKTAARLRAQRALDGLLDSESRIVYCREYTASQSGSSSSVMATLHRDWTRRHDVEPKDDLLQFYDEETGALVIVPKIVGESQLEVTENEG